MRPVRRNQQPTGKRFTDYSDAKADLISRLGSYCSYCERRIATNLAVEHIQPKALSAYQHLILTWDNFLLACVNCNSTKSNKNVILQDVYLPDRDNTGLAFEYLQDGTVQPAQGLSFAQKQIARHTLSLAGLDKKIYTILDENGKQVEIDRVSQRMQAWGIAQRSQNLINKNPSNIDLRAFVANETATQTGFFSIWMSVFAGDIDMRKRLIESFSNQQSQSGTLASECFDPVTTALISPAPNPDGLPDGGKI